MGVVRFVCGASAKEEWCGGVSMLNYFFGLFGWWNIEQWENEFIWVWVFFFGLYLFRWVLGELLNYR